MRDVVILAVSGRLGLRTLAQLCFTIEGVVFAFVSKAVLCQVLVHSDLDLVFLIGIKHEFYLAECLKAVQSNLMKLVQRDYLSWMILV